MTDRKYGDYSRLLRVPELRMLDVETQFLTLVKPVDLDIQKPGATCFYHLQKGSLRFFPDAGASDWIDVEEGTSIGLEDGSHHRWVTARRAGAARSTPDSDEVRLFMGSIDRRHTTIQRLMNALIVMPAHADPHASIVRHCISAIEIDKGRALQSDAIARRLAEIIQLEMLLYAESSLAYVGSIPDAVRHDAALIRGWTAFLNEPARSWTLELLAQSAGISRSAFASRFRVALGTTPLAAIRDIRMRYAADMLRSTQAPVAEIALKVGYRSDTALTRAFRQMLGVTPARWRATARKTPAAVRAVMPQHSAQPAAP